MIFDKDPKKAFYTAEKKICRELEGLVTSKLSWQHQLNTGSNTEDTRSPWRRFIESSEIIKVENYLTINIPIQHKKSYFYFST